MIKGVRACARREIEEHRKTGRFWHDSIQFDSNYFLTDGNKSIASKLYDSLHINKGYNEEKNRKNFEILIANLIRQRRKPLSVSFYRNNWIQTQYNQVSYSIIDMIKILEDRGYLEMKIGYQKKKKQDSRITRIFSTEKLFEIFPITNTGVLFKPYQLIELRDQNKKLKKYEETRITYGIRKKLKLINDVNSEAQIFFNNVKLNPTLKAIFIENFKLYGRLHTSGTSHVQGLSGDERGEITINGDSVVELDYSGLHPNLLYALEGIQFSIEIDPYSEVDKRPILRPFLKKILLCMLNAKNRIVAGKAANFWLLENHWEREQLKKLNITKAAPFISKFVKVHSQISHYFFEGKKTGLRAMNKDSKIAINVVNHFAKKRIPILPIHDSFIVQKQYESELREVMEQNYKKHSNGFSINVKRK